MKSSFEERSVWIQLVSLVTILRAYFVVAGVMMSRREPVLSAFVPLFVAAIVLLVIVLTVGHIVAAIGEHPGGRSGGRPEGRDERDRLIGWRAYSRRSPV